MEGDFIKINEWLMPLSWLYGLGVKLRNMLFDLEIRKSHSFKTPVISIGNITVGGTGKTPHVEYLIRLLQDNYRVAVLSRGYKRKSSGFVIADNQTTMNDIGDEPFQMKQKFPKVTIAVDKKRVNGINRLTNNDSKKSNIDVVLLDDAFQHRQVKPGINILLVDYHRLIIYDKLLPAGRLREPLKGKDRADIVIVTKCPKDLKPMEYRVITKAMNLYPYQQLFFSTLDYEELQPVFKSGKSAKQEKLANLKDKNILLLTGIASPRQLNVDLKPLVKTITPMTFSDHHNFTHYDVQQLNMAFDNMPSPKCIITTEKDAARLLATEGLSDEVRQHLFMLPVHISFMQGQEEAFNKHITSYVHNKTRRTNAHKKTEVQKHGQKQAQKQNTGNKDNSRPRTIKFN